ncbi:hypothetical protein [Achromobacter sp.]|jgi:hypothetical protein|uniref:hypothetical protein n=1 Tax=Achromobacter sp. TaxID=134375 RepID=UPI0028AC23CC|nr:hypothetical protein [Achromobacter sp.]
MQQELSKLPGGYKSNMHRKGHQPYDLAQASQRQVVRAGTTLAFWLDDACNSTGVPRHHKNPFRGSGMIRIENIRAYPDIFARTINTPEFLICCARCRSL